MGDDPIVRRRRTGTYSVVDRATGVLLGTVQKDLTGWWRGYTADGDQVCPVGATHPAIYSTRRGAVSDLVLAVAAPEDGEPR